MSRNNVISCIFWGDNVDYFKPYHGCTTNDIIVVIVQFAKLGRWKGKPTVSNAYDGTKFIINDDQIYEIHHFKERY